MKFCEKCGKELFDEAVFCPGCGCPCKSVSTPKLRAAPLTEKKIIWLIGLAVSFIVFTVIAVLCLSSDQFIRSCDKYNYYLSDYGSMGRSARELSALLDMQKEIIVPYVVAICMSALLSIVSLVSGLVLLFKKK